MYSLRTRVTLLALGLVVLGATAPNAMAGSWDDTYSRESWPAYGLGSPHPVEDAFLVMAAEQAADRRHQQELAEWGTLYGSITYPNYGLGGHTPPHD